jgi:uncharacterized membrane protein YvbJ
MAEKCPKCGGPLGDFSTQALSRRSDDMICDDCGTREAMEDVGLTHLTDEILETKKKFKADK